jgi:hypothetical protein
MLAASIIMELTALMMEEINTTETSVNIYQTTRHNPEDIYLHTFRYENVKSHNITSDSVQNLPPFHVLYVFRKIKYARLKLNNLPFFFVKFGL